MYPIIKLKASKESLLKHRHPWIFSGALVPVHNAAHGDLVHVANSHEEIVATAFYSKNSSIALRVVAWTSLEWDVEYVVAQIFAANQRRLYMGYGPGTTTTGYRVVYGESDGLPGLVVDRYGDCCVFQIGIAGMDRFREMVIDALKRVFAPRWIIERSDMPVRQEEKLEPIVACHEGPADEEVVFQENGKIFIADVLQGQKTGFFLDLKQMRKELPRLCRNANVLNLFSYTGAMGLMTSVGGAKHVHHVDGSQRALDLCHRQYELNGFSATALSTEQADIFPWLAAQDKTPHYDVVILDPPSLIKSRKDEAAGRRSYHFVNRCAMRMLKPGGFLVTSSCSHYLSRENFLFELVQASIPLGRELHMICDGIQAPDHPISPYFSESAYLKAFIFQVT